MNAEYRQALQEVERLRINMREVDPEFQDVAYHELKAAQERVMAIIKERKVETNVG